jgi:hypothetical protein
MFLLFFPHESSALFLGGAIVTDWVLRFDSAERADPRLALSFLFNLRLRHGTPFLRHPRYVDGAACHALVLLRKTMKGMGRLDWDGQDARRLVASIHIGHLTPLNYNQTSPVTVIAVTRVGHFV